MRSWKAPGPLAMGLIVALAVTALSDPAPAEEPQPPPAPRQHRSRDILERIDQQRPEPQKPEPSWLETHVSFHRKGGLQYTDHFQVGDQRFRLAVRGPFRGPIDRRQFGLSFEIRF